MSVNQIPTTAWLIETHGRLLRILTDTSGAGRAHEFSGRSRFCGCCGQLPLYDCGGVLLCARCDTDTSGRT